MPWQKHRNVQDSSKRLHRHASWFAKPLTPHLFFHTISNRDRPFLEKSLLPKFILQWKQDQSWNVATLELQIRRHLLLASNPLYDWIVNQISLNTSKRNYKINQVGRNQKVLDPSPESWARTPQQPPSASVEKLWKIMKNDEIFEFPPKLKAYLCPPCSSRSFTNCQ